MSNARILFRIMDALASTQKHLTPDQWAEVEKLFDFTYDVLSGKIAVRPRPDVVTSQARLVTSLVDSIDTVLQSQEGVSPDAFFHLGGAMALALLLMQD